MSDPNAHRPALEREQRIFSEVKRMTTDYAKQTARALIAERGLSGARTFVTAELNFLTSRINLGAYRGMISEARDQQSYWESVARAMLEESDHAKA